MPRGRHRRSRCPRAAARSAASARSSPPTRSPAPARCRCRSPPAPAAPASARSSRSPTTPARATARSASAGASRCPRSPARPTRACPSTTTPTSPTSSSSPARKTWCRCSSRTRTARGFARRTRPHDRRRHYAVHRYRPRIEGLFARIERWTTSRPTATSTGAPSPRTTSSPSTARTPNSRIADPDRSQRASSRWLICETRDDKGNAVLYEYKPEDGAGVDLTRAHERNRGDRNDPRRTANRYLKRIRYGNRVPLLDDARAPAALPDRPRRSRTPAGCSRWSSTTASTTPTRRRRMTPASGPTAPTRSPPTAPASRCAPAASASGC